MWNWYKLRFWSMACQRPEMLNAVLNTPDKDFDE